MREGWQTKKLGELGKVITGSTPSTRDESNYSSPDVCFVKPSDIAKTGITTISNTEFHISRKAFLLSRKLPQGSVLTTCIGIIGKVGILGVDATCNQQINAIIPDKTAILPTFLAYSILSKQHLLSSIANAPVVPIINKGEFSSVLIPVPPIVEQEKIVAELDCLSGIIEKKKQQLKELDNLAQSIFYDMFGDPITNEKGWEAKKLGAIATLLNGRAYKQDELLDNGKYRVLRVGNFFSNKDYYYSNLELDEDKYCDTGDLLYAWSASFGPKIWDDGKVIYHYHIWKVLYNRDIINKLYLFSLLATITAGLKDEMHGATMMHLTKSGMEQYSVPVPPIDLQNAFAQKMEAIEKQKELIKKSIQEIETLFNSRKDYWFN